MAASNRASRLTKLVADLKKRYKPGPPVQRPLFESVLFGTLLENSTLESANKAFDDLEGAYFDWNEVRVSSRAELAERLKPLHDPLDSADRLKRTLQSIFETVYSFDLEALKKQNLGQAVKQITGFDGVTPFVVNFVTQHGLAGHAIAVNSGVLLAMQVMDIVTEAEAKKGAVPGLERAIPKNKGVEAQAVLHEFGVEIHRSPYGSAARKLLTELDPTCKDRLPKRPAKAPEAPAKEEPAKAAPANASADKKAAAGKSTAKTKTDSKPKTSSGAPKPAAAKEPSPAKPTAAKKPAATKSGAKASESKTPVKKKAAPAAKAKTASPKAAKPKAAKPKAADSKTAKPKTVKAKTAKAKTAKPKTAAKKVAGKKPAKRKPK